MALIVCNNCGKKISDTAKKCVHCGVQISFDADDKKEEKAKKENLTMYYSLPLEEQQRLETEFLGADAEAAAWQAFGEKRKKFSKFARRVLIILFVCGMLIGFASEGLMELFDSDNNTALICLAIGVGGFALVAVSCVLVIVLGFAISLVVFRRKKRFIYFKRFDAWLRQKDIVLDIMFITDYQKNLYENIDLNIDKLWR